MNSQNPLFGAVLATMWLAFLWAPLAASAQDAYEPDDDQASAQTIDNGVVQLHTIHVVGDWDWTTFTVSGTGAQNLHVVSSFDTELYLYFDVGGGTLSEYGYDEPNGPGDDSVIDVASAPPGTYYIRVMERGNDGTLTSPGYQLLAQWDVVSPAADAYEPDNSARTAKPIASGVAQNRTIHAVGDPDLAKFTVGGAGARNVRIVASTGTQLWLIRGGTGEILGYEYTSGAGLDSTVGRTTLPADTYYIKVKEYGNDGTMEYQLSASWEAAPPPAADAFEPDNRWSAAKRIRNGRTQRRTIHAAGNRDWARIDIGGSGARNLHIRTSGLDDDTQLWLYDSDLNRLAYDDNSGPWRFSRIRVPLLMPGRYYIRVQEKGNNGMIPSYLLKASWTPI